MWHLLISIKFYVYGVSFAHLIGITYLFPNFMMHVFGFVMACLLIVAYIMEQVRLDELYYKYNEEPDKFLRGLDSQFEV